MLHLHVIDAGYGLDEFARRFVDALRAAHVARVVERHRLAVEGVFRKLEIAASDCRRDELGIVHGLNLVGFAQAFRLLAVEIFPYQRAGGARGDHRRGAVRTCRRHVLAVHLLEKVPFAGHLHRDAAALLVGP